MGKIGLISFILQLFLLCDHLPGQERTKTKATNPFPKEASSSNLYAPLNINAISSWVSNDGRLSNGRAGRVTFFPRGKVETVFADGFVWGGKAYVDSGKTTPAPYGQTIRVGGATYGSGTRAGRVIGRGTLAMAADPAAEESRVYRIRRDYFTMSDADLRLDAAETFRIDYDSVNFAQMQEIRDRYHRDWWEWPVQFGAPFIDRNGNDLYDPPPAFGPSFSLDDLIRGNHDEPGIYAGFPGGPADQVIWTVFNDLFRARYFGSEPLGLELQLTQWAFKSKYRFRLGIFYRKLKVINKGGVDIFEDGSKGAFWIDDMYIGQWSDADLGNAEDDLAGCDPSINLGFFYNEKEIDGKFNAHLLPPPSVGYIYSQGPRIRSAGDSAHFDNKTISDWKNLPMSSFVYIPVPIGDSNTTYQNSALYWYKSLRGYKRMSGPDERLNFPPGIEPSGFPLAGDPVAGTGHVDGLDLDYSPKANDKRIMISSGPFSLAPGDTQEVVVAFVAGMGADRLSSVALMKYIANRSLLRYPYHATFAFDDLTDPVSSESPVLNYYSLFQNYPNPFQGGTQIGYTIPLPAQVRLVIYDLLGREVVMLENTPKDIGTYETTWNGLDKQGRPAPSGVYFYKMQANHVEISRKLFLLR